jgi:hypothetical protein
VLTIPRPGSSLATPRPVTAVAGADAQLAAERACPNCGTPAPLAYCPACGQAQHALHRSLGSIVADLLDTLAGWDGKIPVTLWLLVRHPGRLTADYVAGRRARYLPPLRLYLTMGALLFLAFQAAAPRMTGFNLSVQGDAGLHVERRRGASPSEAAPPPVAADGAWQRLKRTYFGDRIRTMNALPPAEQQREMKRAFFGRLGTTFFVLLPVVALLLAGLYRRTPLAYADHLVFALHTQAFAAGALAIALLLGGAWGALPLLALPPYVFVSMRRVYGGSRRRTFAKFVLLGAGYFCVLMVAMLVTVMVAFMVG